MSDIKVDVTQGSVTVTRVSLVHSGEGCYVFEIETREKRPEIWGYSTFSVNLAVNDEDGSPVQPVARVSVKGLESTIDNPWMTMVSTERYSALLILYRDDRVQANERDKFTIWSNEQDRH